MSADRFAEIERLYHEASLRRPEERAAFLEKACGGDDALRHEVESLLSLPTDAGQFLSRTALEEAARTSHRPSEPDTWPTIPGYTVRRVLGEGGMGVVYLAEQETPLRRLVALKLIKPGMDTRQVVARFETERQALALMDHPNIAAVFDAGSTDDGRPYFVMEFVEGVAITEYCDRERLSTRDRLALFVQVCAAVQHAHQKGVIHRDLKPSNVLVAERDGHALPKVIDFGTAKAIGGDWNATATEGGPGMVLGTLEYMSPEQAALSADIDTATDVYSLGVLLYELLVGRLPFDTDELRAAGYDEIRRVIRESDPPKPSVRVEQRSDKSGPAARARQTDAPRLTRQLRGDLDWITLKALEKDRTRRYATVAAFATDIGRFLDDQPVEARPPSSTYRVRKFTRRHRGAVAAAVSLFVMLVMGLAASRSQYLRAEAARIEANRQRTEAESERARADLASAKNYNNVGAFLFQQEHFDRATEMYERSLSIKRTPVAVSNLARAYYEQGLFADAARTFETAVAMPGPTYQLWANLGAACYFAPGLRDRARVAYETAIKLGEERRDVTPKDAGVLAALADAHAVLSLLSDGAGAATHAAFARSLIAAIERLKPSGADILFTVASTHEELGDRTQALEWLAKAIRAGYPMNSVRRSPWLKALRSDPGYVKQFPQR